MPIRLLTTLIILSTLVLMLLVGPLLTPIPKLETQPAAQLASPTSQFVDVAGYTLHYDQRRQSSDADAAVSYVLLHGFIGNTFAWRQVLDELTQPANINDVNTDNVSETTVSETTVDETTVDNVKAINVNAVAYDRLGFGLSARPLRNSWSRGANPYTFEAQQTRLLELVAALELTGEVILVGHDTGAALALALAEHNPERFAGVVLVAPVPEVTSNLRGLWRLLIRTPQVDRLGPLFMRQLAGGPGENMLRSSLPDPDSISSEVIEGYRQNTQVDNWDKSLWELSRASTNAVSPTRTPKEIPVLVIASRDDQLVPFASSQALARDLAAPLVNLAECGHLPQEVCPQALSQAMTNWVTDTVLD
ncbi:MAG: alpha/beta hydrolase [Deinococcota bacterium]